MGLLNLCAVFQAARDEKVDDFGALNSARPEAESNPERELGLHLVPK